MKAWVVQRTSGTSKSGWKRPQSKRRDVAKVSFIQDKKSGKAEQESFGSHSQGCTTSRKPQRATSGPRWVVMWLTTSNKKATISDTTLTLNQQWCAPNNFTSSRCYLNDLNLKEQGENQLGYHIVNHVSAFKGNRCWLNRNHQEQNIVIPIPTSPSQLQTPSTIAV